MLAIISNLKFVTQGRPFRFDVCEISSISGGCSAFAYLPRLYDSHQHLQIAAIITTSLLYESV